MIIVKKMTRLAWSGALTTSGTKPVARNSGSAIAYNNNMYIFGGIVSGVPQQDTHKIDLTSLDWSGEISTSGTNPNARYFNASVSYDKYMYVFGGTNGSSPTYSDTHRLDLTNNTWSGELNVSGNKPTRYAPACIVYSNYMYLFGGHDGTNYKNDVRRLDLSNLAWSDELSTSGTPPTARYGYSLVVYGNYMYVFGGVDNVTYLPMNDVHRLNLNTLAWSGTLSTTGTPAGTRFFQVGVAYGRYMYIFGGNNSSNNNTYRIDMDNLVWSGVLSCSGTPPSARTNHIGIAYNSGFYIFSGNNMNNDLFRLEGLM